MKSARPSCAAVRALTMCATCATCATWAASAVAAGDEPPGAGVDAWLFSSEAYRLRAAQDGSVGDNDARWLVDGGARAFDGALGLDVSGALFWDLDGGNAPEVASVHDARGPLDVFVDTLELRVNDVAFVERASVGRLTVVEGWPITLDGAAVAIAPVETAELAWVVFASAGRTVHFFEAPSEDGGGAFEDWAASAGTDVVLTEGWKLQLDYRALLEDSGARGMQHSYGGALVRRVGDVLVLQVAGRGIDGALSHLAARAHVAWQPWRVGLDVDALQQTITLGEVFEGQNPFFAVLGESLPHLRGSADAWGRMDLGVLDGGLHVGAAGRSVLAAEQTPFNRDSARVYVALDAADVAAVALTPGLFASVLLSYDFAVAPRQDSVTALGGSAGWNGELVRCALGTSWDRTKYTYYRDVNELIDVRTVFASAEVRPLRLLRVRADYTLELAADRVLHTGQLTLAHELGGAW